MAIGYIRFREKNALKFTFHELPSIPGGGVGGDVMSPDLMAKFIFLWTGKVENGNLRNDLGPEYITVTGRDFVTAFIPDNSIATFSVPDSPLYLNADGTDNFWFNAIDQLQSKTLGQLILSETMRTFVRYSDFFPFNVYAIGILREGEILTNANQIELNEYFKLWAEYWGVLMDSGYMKDNRV